MTVEQRIVTCSECDGRGYSLLEYESVEDLLPIPHQVCEECQGEGKQKGEVRWA